MRDIVAAKYMVDYYIKKFKAIPAKHYTTSNFTSPLDPKKHCALGHCGVTCFYDAYNTPEAVNLRDLFKIIRASVISVNDGESAAFTQKSPKARILAALNQIKKIQVK